MGGANSILDAAEQQEASDVFLQENEVPRLKVNEKISVFGEEPLSLVDIVAFWESCGANTQGDGDMIATVASSRARIRATA